MGWGESCLKSLEEHGPRRELAVGRHPLKPRKRVPFHVKRRDGESFILWCSVVFKKLVDFENPTKRFCAIKEWNLELHFVALCRYRWWGGVYELEGDENMG